MSTLPYPHGRTPVVIDEAFEQEARAMQKAMDTGELPPESAPYFDRVQTLAKMHWAAKTKKPGGRP